MDLKRLDPLLKIVPTIPNPQKPISHKMRFAYSLIIIAVFMVLMNIPIYGVFTANQALSNTLFIYLLSPNAFSIAALGISPIVLAIILVNVVTAKIFKHKPESEEERERLHKLAAAVSIVLAILLAIPYTFYYSYEFASTFPIVFLELIIGFLVILYAQGAGRIYGITSGVNLFIISLTLLSIIYGLLFAILPNLSTISFGSPNTVSNIVLNFLPLAAQIFIIAAAFITYNRFIKPSIKLQSRVSGEDPGIPYLYNGPLALVTAMIFLMVLSFIFIAPSSAPNTHINNILTPQNPAFYPVIGESYSGFFTTTFFSTSPVSIPFIGTYLLPLYIIDIIFAIELVIATSIFTILWRILLYNQPDADKNRIRSEDKVFLKSSIPLALILMLSIFIGTIGGIVLMLTGIILAIIYEQNSTLINERISKFRQGS